jgi:hypothetical protein
MQKSVRTNFLLITIAQAFHSTEEYLGKLWEVYPPATFLCRLVSSDPRTGFIIIDVGLIIFLFLIWLISKNVSVLGLMWFWTIMEIINGLGHLIWAIMESSYEPGLITAPVLLFLSIRMIKLFLRQQDAPLPIK